MRPHRTPEPHVAGRPDVFRAASSPDELVPLFDAFLKREKYGGRHRPGRCRAYGGKGGGLLKPPHDVWDFNTGALDFFDALDFVPVRHRLERPL
ncbi:hypothetical protein E1292_16785 [Nonomuraea deserti]|uniref:Uncharacterized protein n=1 Tax=Nonomuraea deserti TaxID=1848322 RepID=A0A4R4VJ33_9ACTN|nr:hypothetical protein [Nonomuraea deserti]TDD05532.1 hypothetical protein E1292_16785 [Nonomuraea deserti]